MDIKVVLPEPGPGQVMQGITQGVSARTVWSRKLPSIAFADRPIDVLKYLLAGCC